MPSAVRSGDGRQAAVSVAIARRSDQAGGRGRRTALPAPRSRDVENRTAPRLGHASRRDGLARIAEVDWVRSAPDDVVADQRQSGRRRPRSATRTRAGGRPSDTLELPRSVPDSADADDEERDRDVLARERADRQRVEQLVVPEHLRERVRPAKGVDDGARGVGEAAGCRGGSPARSRRGATIWGIAATPAQPSATPRTADNHFGARTQQSFIETAAAAPDHTIARVVNPPRSVEADQPDRRVRPGDQQEDAGVVGAPHPEPRRRSLPTDAVVERARPQHHRRREGER